MWSLPERTDDFRMKYNESVGLIKLVNEKPKPIYIVGGECTITHITGFIINNNLKWEKMQYDMESIEDLSFPFPYTGYVELEGCWPAFLWRSMVKSVRRGWNSTSMAVETHRLFDLISSRVNVFGKITSVNASRLIHHTWIIPPHERFTKLRDIQGSDKFFHLLAPQFAAVKQNEEGTHWNLMFENFLVGDIVDGETMFYKKAEYLRDLYELEVAQA